MEETKRYLSNRKSMSDLMDNKPRKYFIVKDKDGNQTGHGVYYPFGDNVQVFLNSSKNASWQEANLGQVLLLKDVACFEWVKEKTPGI